MTDEPNPRATPIYSSFGTFTTLLDWLRETKHIPSQFDRSWWGSKFNGTTGAQLMAGLKFLGLLGTDNRPDDSLEALAFASNEARPQKIAELLRDIYGASLVDGLMKMTPKMMTEAIAALGTTPATHRKAVAFFINAAKAANLPMPSSIAKQARNRPSATTTRGKGGPANRRGGRGGGGGTGTTIETPPPVLTEKDKELDLPAGLHPALRSLLRDLVKDGGSWKAPVRARWKATWDQTLDYVYPLPDDAEGK